VNYKRIFSKPNPVGFVLCAGLLVSLNGCIGYVDRPPQGSVYVEPNAIFAVQDDYIYYPNYQVYYSNSRHQYAYPEGGRWVSQPAPRGVSVNMLQASPAVKMNFHDSPANHHAAMVQQYPKNWPPPQSNQGQKQNHNGDQSGQNNGR
jgi:hypothetical protein